MLLKQEETLDEPKVYGNENIFWYDKDPNPNMIEMAKEDV